MATIETPLVAIVIPWFGRELTGGAELQAWQMAERLGARGHRVEVFTTTSRSAQDDYASNYYKPGCYSEDKFVIRRFKVARRPKKALGCALRAIQSVPVAELFPGCSPVSGKDSQVFAEGLIRSPSLLRYLKKNSDNYHAFIFLPYLFSPILKGLPIVAEKGYLQACLHDEWYAYLPEVADVFRKAKGLLFNSEGEYELARKLYGPSIEEKSHLIGEGIEVEQAKGVDLSVVHPEIGAEPFILYIGRKCNEKNVNLLVDAYDAFMLRNPDSRLKLVLAGIGDSYQERAKGSSLVDLGRISEEEKWRLIAQCRALMQPSVNESFSRVIFEAWHMGRPVGVNAACLATQKAVECSRGGWAAETLEDWVQLMGEVDLVDDEELSKLGAQGQQYAREIANWDAVMERYERALFSEREQGSFSVDINESYPRIPIHQLSAGFASGDAISNIAIKFREYLRGEGFPSFIYAEHACKRAQKSRLVESLTKFKGAKEGVLLYHHSIGSASMDKALEFKGIKGFFYHNVTPPEFFEKENPSLAGELRQGVDSLRNIGGVFDLFGADSEYNAKELLSYGVKDASCLPCFFDFKGHGLKGDQRVMHLGSTSLTNILFVGRISPHKQQHLLIEAFARYLRHNPDSHLYIVGGSDPSGFYYKSLLYRIQALKLQNYVTFTGKVSDSELVSYFRIADLYWSFSAHEGFGIPLIEAMAFDVPVLAYGAAAIPEVMGEGGLIFNDLKDLNKVAALASVLVKDKTLRSQVIAAQRENIKRFTWENSRQIFAGMVNQLLEKRFSRDTVDLQN